MSICVSQCICHDRPRSFWGSLGPVGLRKGMSKKVVKHPIPHMPVLPTTIKQYQEFCKKKLDTEGPRVWALTYNIPLVTMEDMNTYSQRYGCYLPGVLYALAFRDIEVVTQ